MLFDKSSVNKYGIFEVFEEFRTAVIRENQLLGIFFDLFPVFYLLGVCFLALEIFGRLIEFLGQTVEWRIFYVGGALSVFFTLNLRFRFQERIKFKTKTVAQSCVLCLVSVSFFGLYSLFASTFDLFPESGNFFLVPIVIFAGYEIFKKRDSFQRTLHLKFLERLFVFVFLLLGLMQAWSHLRRLTYWLDLSNSLSLTTVLMSLGIPFLLFFDFSSGKFRSVLIRVFDVGALLLFVFLGFRKDIIFSHDVQYNWPLFLAPSSYIRQGGWLLKDVASQYGFLNVILVSLFKNFSVIQVFYSLNAFLTTLCAFFSYQVMRMVFSGVGSALAIIPAVLFTSFLGPGWAPASYGVQSSPSTGPFRFFWCYCFIYLMVSFFKWNKVNDNSIYRVSWVGSVFWILGSLWSPESLFYSSVCWFSVLFLLDSMRDVPSFKVDDSIVKSIMKSFLVLRFPLILAGLVLVGILFYYGFFLHELPFLINYLEYPLIFKIGFGYYERNLQGPFSWLIFLFFLMFIGLFSERNTKINIPGIVGLFCFWATSSYYCGRSHDQNVLNIIPIGLISLGACFAVRESTKKQTVLGAFLYLQFRLIFALILSYFVLILFIQPTLTSTYYENIMRAYQIDLDETYLKGSYSRQSLEDAVLRFVPVDQRRCLINLNSFWENHAPEKFSWLPFLDSTTYDPLSPERRKMYFDKFEERVDQEIELAHCGRWFVYHDNFAQAVQWEVGLILGRYEVANSFYSSGWHFYEMTRKKTP